MCGLSEIERQEFHKMKDIKTLSSDLSSFIQETEIKRIGRCASIIVDTIVDEQHGKVDIHLCGFLANGDKSDFEIKEEGFLYLQKIIEDIEEQKRTKLQ